MFEDHCILMFDCNVAELGRSVVLNDLLRLLLKQIIPLHYGMAEPST